MRNWTIGIAGMIIGIGFIRNAFAGDYREIPAEYREAHKKLDTWIDQKIAEWKPEVCKPMEFAGYMVMSSENMIGKTNSSVDMGFLDMFINELGVDVIAIALYPYMFKKYSQRYDDIIKRVRDSNKKLYISYMIGDDVRRTFEQYRSEQIKFTRDFVVKYKPDYYVIVDEYTTISKRGDIQATEVQWKELVKDVAGIVKEISPNIKTVATGHCEELGFLRSLADINDLDYIGFNIWGVYYIKDDNNRAGEAIEYVKSKGKGVVFEQTWAQLLDEKKMREINSMEFMADINGKYIKMLAYYGQKYGCDIYSPFYTGKFFSHDATSAGKFITALMGKQRSPEFYAYKETIKEIKKK